MVSTYCRNHRLALCITHLLKRWDTLVEADARLLSLFQFSPQKLAVLIHVQEVYGERPLVIVREAATRWLSHLKACGRVTERYRSILDVLDSLYNERKDPELFGKFFNFFYSN